MDAVGTVISRMRSNDELPALIWQDQTISYARLCTGIDEWRERLDRLGVGVGTICGVLGDYSPQTTMLMFALMQVKAILVPFTYSITGEIPTYRKIAGVECLFHFKDDDSYEFERFSDSTRPELIESFIERGHAGLVVFSSGSTGTPKGILQDCELVTRKFLAVRKSWRTILFLLMDHFGGFNTWLSSFAYGGVGICVADRSPENVCRAVGKARATLLPTTPTFLNFLIASQCHKRYDLSSIELITYGTELMPQTTLDNVRSIFPNAKIKQTYGLSELGVLRSVSEDDASVWVKIGGDGFETKVIDNILWVRSQSNMVGYLNAPNPIDENGWMSTGDQVEVKGDYMRFLGRQSEMINVGGQKVFPVEVETVLLQAENVCEAAVYGVRHPIMGQVVHAKVSLYKQEDSGSLTERLRKHCIERMAKYKVPMRFVIVESEQQHSDRFKKIRRE